MSIRLMSQVWEDTRIESQAELLVLLALADHARDDGLCWPSMRSIAGKARIEERSAQRIIRRLIEKGLVELVSQGGCIDGCNTPNRYRVIGTEARQTHGVTEGRPGASVSRGVRGDPESPRGDREDTKGVTHGHPNHQIEPLTERITTTHPQGAKNGSQGSEPSEASSSRRDSRAIRTAQEPGLLQARVSGLVNRLTAEFALSNKQREAVREYCTSPGIEYVETKADIVRMQPRRNAAGALLAALRDDWQVPVSIAGAIESDGDHLATSDELARRMGWQW
jgi:Helix-turn-helix domain